MEDREFLAAFDKLMVDDLQNRRGEKPKVPNMDIALPMNLKGQLARRRSISEEEQTNFVLMTRGKGSKQLYKDLHIPLPTDLAANIREKQMAELAEQEEMKRLVLDYNQRQEEEVYNGEGMEKNTDRGTEGHTQRRRDRHKHTDIDTDRRRGRHKHTHRQTRRDGEIYTSTDTSKQTDRHRDGEIDKLTTMLNRNYVVESNFSKCVFNFFVEMMAQQRQSAESSNTKSHSRHRRRPAGGNDTVAVFSNMTR